MHTGQLADVSIRHHDAIWNDMQTARWNDHRRAVTSEQCDG